MTAIPGMLHDFFRRKWRIECVNKRQLDGITYNPFGLERNSKANA
jgi:hypothetical protein